jgi:restriction endonuclease S subunit
MSVCKLNDDYSEKINLKFVYYYLKSKKEHIEQIYQTGQNQKSLDVDNFNRFLIPIPDIEKQNEIVKYCDHLMNAIDNNKIIIQKNIELIDSILNL